MRLKSVTPPRYLHPRRRQLSNTAPSATQGTASNMGLNTQQRRERILHQIVERGHVNVRDLASGMDVSEATVRRDLRGLADERRIELVYGGATLPRTADFSFQSKAARNVEAKRVIGRLAASLVQDDEMLFIDSGTTCYEMRHHLHDKRGLTVIANSARLAVELGASTDARLVILGGQYRSDRMDTVGPLAQSAIDQMRGYVAFFGADGLGPDFGVSAADIDTAHLYQHVIRNAREAILVVDYAKFLSPSLYRIAPLEAVSRIVTDQQPPEEWQERLLALGIDLVTPSDGAAGEGGRTAPEESGTRQKRGGRNRRASATTNHSA